MMPSFPLKRICVLAAGAFASAVVLSGPVLAQSSQPAASSSVSQGAVAQQDQSSPSPQKPTETQKPAETKKPTETQKPAEAQKEGEPQLPHVQSEVFVTAPRIDVPLKDAPAATAVVGAPVLDTMPRAIGAEEAFQSVPGMKVDNQADGERVHMSIRGQGLLTETGIRGITVLYDGLPLNDPAGFVRDLFDVDWSAVQRVEVYRGVASALYGGGSAGGVINIVTRDGGPGGPQGQASLTLGQDSFWKPYADAGGTRGNMNYRVSASMNTGDGYRLHTNFDAVNTYGKFRWTLPKATFTAIVGGTHYFNQNAEGLNLAWDPNSPSSPTFGQGVEWARQANPDSLTYNEYQNTNRMTLGMTGKVQLEPNQDFSFNVYYRRTWWTESVPSSVNHQTFSSPGVNAQYTVHLTSGPIKQHITAGLDVSWQNIDAHANDNVGNAVEGATVLENQTIYQRGIGIYGTDRIEFNPQWALTLSGRTDAIENALTDILKFGAVDLSGTRNFDKATARAGLAWNPRPDFGVYTSIGQGFLPPSINELAQNPIAIGGFNNNLVPATSHGEEIGIRGAASGFTYDVAFFHLGTDNDFGRYRVAARPLETFYGNVGTTRRFGLETALGYYPTTHLALTGAYTYSHFIYTNVTDITGQSYSGTFMPNAPTHQFNFDVEYKVNGNWAAGFDVFGQSMQYVDQSNVTSAGGFTLCTPRVGYRWHGAKYDGEMSFSGRNVFGTEYMAFTEPDPDGNSFHPGSGREALATVKILYGGKR